MVEFRTNNELLEKYVNSQMENLVQIDSLQNEYDELLYQRIELQDKDVIKEIKSL